MQRECSWSVIVIWQIQLQLLVFFFFSLSLFNAKRRSCRLSSACCSKFNENSVPVRLMETLIIKLICVFMTFCESFYSAKSPTRTEHSIDVKLFPSCKMIVMNYVWYNIIWITGPPIQWCAVTDFHHWMMEVTHKNTWLCTIFMLCKCHTNMDNRKCLRSLPLHVSLVLSWHDFYCCWSKSWSTFLCACIWNEQPILALFGFFSFCLSSSTLLSNSRSHSMFTWTQMLLPMRRKTITKIKWSKNTRNKFGSFFFFIHFMNLWMVRWIQAYTSSPSNNNVITCNVLRVLFTSFIHTQ